MDERFREKYAHVVKLYPGMEYGKRMQETARLLSADLGPFWVVSDDGEVTRNRSWRKDLDPIHRTIYDDVDRAMYPDGNRSRNPVAEEAVELYRSLVTQKNDSNAWWQIWKSKYSVRPGYQDIGLAWLSWKKYLSRRIIAVAVEKIRAARKGETNPGRPIIKPGEKYSATGYAEMNKASGGEFDVVFDSKFLDSLNTSGFGNQPDISHEIVRAAAVELRRRLAEADEKRRKEREEKRRQELDDLEALRRRLAEAEAKEKARKEREAEAARKQSGYWKNDDEFFRWWNSLHTNRYTYHGYQTYRGSSSGPNSRQTHPNTMEGWKAYVKENKHRFHVEYTEHGEIIYPHIGMACDLAITLDQTIVVWVRESKGLTRFRVSPNNVASEVMKSGN